MSLLETLEDFVGSIAIATSDPPDSYPAWSLQTYESHRADLMALWSSIRPRLKRDMELATWVDETLQAMIAAFDTGDKVTGRKLAWELYNAELSKLR